MLSTAEMAAEEGVTVQYVSRLERAGVISKSGRGKYAESELAKMRAFRAGEPLPGEDSPASLTEERVLLRLESASSGFQSVSELVAVSTVVALAIATAIEQKWRR